MHYQAALHSFGDKHLLQVLTSLRKLKHLNLSACDYLEVASQASAELLLQTAPSLLQIDLK